MNKEKKPLYKRWWVILIGVILAISIIGALIDSGEAEKKENVDHGKIVSIEATYNGETEAGTLIDKGNKGIKVQANYEDETTKRIKKWEVVNPAKLEADKTSTFEIKSGKLKCELEITCTTISEANYKKQCKSISYDNLARDPDKYISQYVKFTGQVIQVMEDGHDVQLRVDVTKGEYGIYEDTVYVEYVYSDGESKILEEDIITFYGVSAGTITYETVMGDEVTIPGVAAEYIDIE